MCSTKERMRFVFSTMQSARSRYPAVPPAQVPTPRVPEPGQDGPQRGSCPTAGGGGRGDAGRQPVRQCESGL